MTMIAFHGDPAVQAMYLARIRAHAAADEIEKGFYWEDGKGCAVGCTVHSDDHYAYETELGIPVQIAQIEDVIFEALKNGDSKAWPERFLSAIPLGADLSQVWPQFAAWLMDDPTYGVAHTTEDAEVKELCLEVARRYRAGETTGADAQALADRLRAAWAARAARAAWAAWAAWDARAAWAAWAAWDAWDARAAWAATYDSFVSASADSLVVLLQNAPVAVQVVP